MTDHEVERALGYTPCVCGVIDGTWHWRCYRGKTDAELKAGIALAFRNARRHLKKQRAEALRVACGKTPNVRVEGPPEAVRSSEGLCFTHPKRADSGEPMDAMSQFRVERNRHG